MGAADERIYCNRLSSLGNSNSVTNQGIGKAVGGPKKYKFTRYYTFVFSMAHGTVIQHGTGTESETGTIGNNRSWSLSLSWTSVNISTAYCTFHLVPVLVLVPFPCSVIKSSNGFLPRSASDISLVIISFWSRTSMSSQCSDRLLCCRLYSTIPL